MPMKTKTAQRKGECSWCDQSIAIGDELFPVYESVCHFARAISTNTPQPTTTSTSRLCFWVHAHPCASNVFQQLDKPIEPPACRHWLRLGQQCPFGDDCFFLHPTDIALHIPTPKRTWGGKRKKLFKPTSSIFRAWLIRKFGRDFLGGGGSGVVEVAGGKGELAFELQNLCGIPTTVVDPRPLTLRNAYLKWKSGHYDKAAANPVLKRFLTHYNPHQTPTYPGHLRVFLDTNLTEKVLEYQQSTTTIDDQPYSEWWQQRRDYAQQQAWTRKGLEVVANNQHDETNYQEVDVTLVEGTNIDTDDPWLSNAPSDIADACAALSILSNGSAIVGMHPDQATEAAVDFALQTNKPFAVVPCCVFSNQFPHRQLKDGTPVKTTPQLIQYLLEKDEQRIQVETLGFEGMNRVVFWNPGSETEGGVDYHCQDQ
jgi:Zinc finger C-x8-C-x5-C-x3-H type (and similar)